MNYESNPHTQQMINLNFRNAIEDSNVTVVTVKTGQAEYIKEDENKDYYEVHRSACSIGCIDKDNPDEKGEVIVKRLECVENEEDKSLCKDASLTKEACNPEPPMCEAQYTEWSSWTECSKTCTFDAEDISLQSRIRTCTSNNRQHCLKGNVETKACSVETCSISGKQSN